MKKNAYLSFVKDSMNNQIQRLSQTIMQNPFTWVVLVVCLGFPFLFNWWFHPGIFIFGLVILSALLLIVFWGLLFTRSKTLMNAINEFGMSSLDVIANFNDLKSCSDAFQKPALNCLKLTEKIQTEFNDQSYKNEINDLLQNLYQLIKNHANLFQRAKKFGTENQKKHMQDILKNQTDSVQKTLTALESFSGNLTLLAVHSTFTPEINNDLKSINQGLSAAIEEVENDPF